MQSCEWAAKPSSSGRMSGMLSVGNNLDNADCVSLKDFDCTSLSTVLQALRYNCSADLRCLSATQYIRHARIRAPKGNGAAYPAGLACLGGTDPKHYNTTLDNLYLYVATVRTCSSHYARQKTSKTLLCFCICIIFMYTIMAQTCG